MKEPVVETLEKNHSELPAGFTMRSATKGDLEAVVDLVNLAFRDLLHAEFFSAQRLGSEWEAPGFNLETDSQVVLNPEEQIVGYFDVFDLYEPHVRIYCFGQEHPAYPQAGIASALIRWAEQRARLSIQKAPEGTRVALLANTLAIDEKMKRCYLDHGFNTIRQSLRMVIELNGEIPQPVWPEGITLRPFVLGRDDEITVRAVREAFADHWGYVERPFESEMAFYRHMWETDETFDPNLYFLAMDQDQVAGISLCHRFMEEDPEMGWVGTLGVLRPWRRKGLGLALLHHSFHAFKAYGKVRAGLGVDAQNLTGATRLYEKAGMHADPRWSWAILEKELRSGKDLSLQTLEQS